MTPSPRLTLNEQLTLTLKNYRATFKVSQSEIAERSGLTQAAIARLEAGTANPTLATMQKLFDGLGVTGQLQIRPKR